MLPYLALLALLDPKSIIPKLCKIRREEVIRVDKYFKPYYPNNNHRSNALCCHPPSPLCKVDKQNSPKSNLSNKRSCCFLSFSCSLWSKIILMDMWDVTSAPYKETSSMHIMRSLCQVLHNTKHIDIWDFMWWPNSLKWNQNEHAFFCCIISLIHKAWIIKSWAIRWYPYSPKSSQRSHASFISYMFFKAWIRKIGAFGEWYKSPNGNQRKQAC